MRSEPVTRPEVSIGVACYNEAEHLEHLRQRYAAGRVGRENP